MNKPPNKNRRRFLRNAGVCLALPTFASLLPKEVRAQDSSAKRLVLIHHPNGTTQGRDDADVPSVLRSRFDAHRDRMTIVKNMSNAGLKNAQAATGYYTPHMAGLHVLYSGDTFAGVGAENRTVDQDIAASFGGEAPIESLAINCFQKRNPQEGVSPQHFNNVSWKGPSQPVQPFQDPRRLFERLFSSGGPEVDPRLAARVARRGLYLDAVVGEISGLRARLGRADQRHLDEYLTGVEEIDRRTQEMPAGPLCSSESPAGLDQVTESYQGENYARVLDLMQELSLRALQCGQTRVITMSHAGCANGSEILGAIDRSQFEGVSTGWHGLSHWDAPYGNLSLDVELNRRDYDRLLSWHYDRVSRFVGRLKETIGPDGVPLLDDTLVSFGSHMSYGPHHSASELYQIMFGGGSSFIHGTEVDAGRAPSSNLWATVKRGFGLPATQGRSTGELGGVLT